MTRLTFIRDWFELALRACCLIAALILTVSLLSSYAYASESEEESVSHVAVSQSLDTQTGSLESPAASADPVIVAVDQVSDHKSDSKLDAIEDEGVSSLKPGTPNDSSSDEQDHAAVELSSGAPGGIVKDSANAPTGEERASVDPVDAGNMIASMQEVQDSNYDSNSDLMSASTATTNVASISTASESSYVTYSATVGGSVRATNSTVWTQEVTEFFSSNYSGLATGAVAKSNTGYRFEGWIDSDTGILISNELSFTPSKPASGWPATWNFFATFRPDTFVIKTSGNGGIGAGTSLTCDFGKTVPVPGNGDEGFIRPGYTFSGWDVAPAPSSDKYGGMHFDPGDSLDASLQSLLLSRGYFKSGNALVLTLFATWIEKNVSITYGTEGNGTISIAGVGSLSSDDSPFTGIVGSVTGRRADGTGQSGAYGVKAHADRGHHFDGWKVASDGTDVTASVDSAALESHELSSKDVSSISRSVSSDSDYNILHNIELTASFALNSYNVQYDSNDGTGSVFSTTVSYDSDGIDNSIPSQRNGLLFDGWNSKADGSGVSFSSETLSSSHAVDELISSGLLSDSDGASIRLYAMWKAVVPPSNNETSYIYVPNPTPTVPVASAEKVMIPTIEQVVQAVAPALIARPMPVLADPILLPSPSTVVDAVVLPTLSSPIVTVATSDSSDSGLFDDLSNMSSAQAVAATGSVVTAVATVGTAAALFGVGASAMGAAAAGAAGAAGATGATSAADLFADFAAGAKAAGKGPLDRLVSPFSKRRRRKNDGDAE